MMQGGHSPQFAQLRLPWWPPPTANRPQLQIPVTSNSFQYVSKAMHRAPNLKAPKIKIKHRKWIHDNLHASNLVSEHTKRAHSVMESSSPCSILVSNKERNDSARLISKPRHLHTIIRTTNTNSAKEQVASRAHTQKRGRRCIHEKAYLLFRRFRSWQGSLS